MKIPLLILSLVFIAFTADSQGPGGYFETDRVALNIPDSQSNTTANIAAYINDHFHSDEDKARAAYIWVISHIRYNSEGVHRIVLQEDWDQLITYAMKRKEGVCENFAAIFDDICKKLSLRSFVIEGYTKQGGPVDRTAHAWCAVFLNNKWSLYDPTWDAGNAAGFAIPVNTRYYQVSPSTFIETHMPFDPLFQLIDYPITYKEFNTGNIRSGDKTYFNYTDSISAYEQLNPYSAYTASVSRIERNGPLNHLINTKLTQLKMEIEIINQDKDSVNYNSAVSDYNAGVSIFNNFINWRNNQFKPAKTDGEVQSIFRNIEKHIVSARDKIREVNNSKATLTLNTGDLETALDNLSKHAREQQAFFRDYKATAREN